MSKKTLLLSVVQEMLDGNILCASCGICANIDDLAELNGLGYLLVETFSPTWENFTGDEGFPVCDPDTYARLSNLWAGKQLELRMSLLEHIKSELLKLTDEEVEEMFGDN